MYMISNGTTYFYASTSEKNERGEDFSKYFMSANSTHVIQAVFKCAKIKKMSLQFVNVSQHVHRAKANEAIPSIRHSVGYFK